MKGKFISLISIIFLLSNTVLLQGNNVNKEVTTKRFAMIVGANNGGSGRVRLKYAISDAKSFMKVLHDMGGVMTGDSTLLAEPDSSQFFSIIKKFNKKIKNAKDKYKRVELIFYYSGHSDEENILIGKDKVSYKDIKNAITNMKADVRIAILDSCASGAFTREKGGKKKLPFLVDAAFNMKGYAFMTSSSVDEASQESERLKGSFFTHYLISGLRGAADLTQDGRITLSEAYQFAFNETLFHTEKTMSGPQHPNYNIKMSGTGDVVITDMRKSSAVLRFDRFISGKIFIRDEKNILVVELNKPFGRNIEIGLEEGRYRIINIMEGHIYESKITLKEGDHVELNRNKFSEIDKIPTKSRGDLPQAPSEEKEPPYFRVPFNFSFLGKMTKKPKVIRNFSLHILSSDCTVLNGVSIGAGINFVSEEVNGLQISGIGNTVGRNFRFLQVSGIFNRVGGHGNGVQIAGIFNTTNNVSIGCQIAGVFNYAGNLTGIQISGAWNIVNNDCKYLQIAGVFNIVRGNTRGFQTAGVFNYTRGLIGGQIGTVNIAQDVNGLQIGVINIAQYVKGTQIGVINFAKESEHAPIGLISFFADGKTNINLWSDELGFFNFGLKHGGKHFYNQYLIGVNYKVDQGFLGLGYGINIPTSKNTFFNIDLIGKVICPMDKIFTENTAILTSLNLSLGINVSKGLSLFGGISYNYFNNFNHSDDSDIQIPKPFHGWTLGQSSDHDLHWIGLFFGLQVPLSN